MLGSRGEEGGNEVRETVTSGREGVVAMGRKGRREPESWVRLLELDSQLCLLPAVIPSAA